MADIRVRVGQENAVKVIASVSGSSGGRAVISDSVIGGIASVTQLNVSGISTFVGIATFLNDTYINTNLYFREYSEYGVAYAGNSGQLLFTGPPSLAISTSNYILSTDNFGIPTWTSTIDGGSY